MTNKRKCVVIQYSIYAELLVEKDMKPATHERICLIPV